MGRAGGRVHGAVAASLALLLAGWGCAPPDTPPTLSGALPVELAGMVRPDTARAVRLGPGVVYRYLWSAEGPWAIHLVEADLTQRCDLTLDVLRAEAREHGAGGREVVTSMVGRAGPSVVAAVNADFFTPEGGTVGSELVDGVVTAARRRPALAWRSGGAPWMGAPTIAGGRIELGPWTVPIAGGDGRTEAVGGYPVLLHAGEVQEDLGNTARTRHPRTAVGLATTRGRFWLVVVDGRQSPHSSGMTLEELSAFMLALGADEALNLDGGGSTVMVVGGRVVNHPSDEEGERPVVNALALRRERARC